MLWAHKNRGFTIVELLIVIVVIAILATVTIVAYNGIQNRAKASAAQSEAAQVAKRLESIKLQNPSEQYPATLAAAGIQTGSGTTVDYNYSPTANTYCFSATIDTASYYVTSSRITPRVGNCDVSTGAAAWWKFNGNATSETGVGSGTVVGATLTTGQNGAANGAYNFSAGGHRIDLPGSWATNLPEISGSAWVRRTSAGGTLGIMLGSGPAHWESITGNWRVRLNGVDRINIVAAAPVGVWSHVAFTYQRSTGNFAYYIEGQQVQSVTGVDSATNNYFATGAIGHSLDSTRQWYGDIDDFRIYSRALTAEEVKTIYEAGAQ